MPPSKLPCLRSASSLNLSVKPSFLAIKPRFSSSTSASEPSPPASITETLPPRWLSDIKLRIGKCISFGLRDEQVDEAGDILRVVARDWRELVAGSEGFLTGRRRAGFEGRDVVWGEMVRSAVEP